MLKAVTAADRLSSLNGAEIFAFGFGFNDDQKGTKPDTPLSPDIRASVEKFWRAYFEEFRRIPFHADVLTAAAMSLSSTQVRLIQNAERELSRLASEAYADMKQCGIGCRGRHM